MIIQQVNTYSHFEKPESSSPCSQKPAFGTLQSLGHLTILPSTPAYSKQNAVPFTVSALRATWSAHLAFYDYRNYIR